MATSRRRILYVFGLVALFAGCSTGASDAQVDAAGCVVGETQACGTPVRVAGEQVTCSDGLRTCGADGAWGACVGSGTSSLTIKGLGTPSTCPDNPCDPNCRRTADTPKDLDAAAPLTADEAGLTVIPNPPPAPSDWKGLVVTPDPGIIRIVAIPRTSAPVATPYPLHMTATLLPTGGGPGVDTGASWSLDDYNTTTIDGLGDVRAFYPVARKLSATARVGSFTASAPVQVIVDAAERDPAVSTAVFAKFGDTPAGSDPMVTLYPYDNTTFPRSLTPPVVQWSNGGTAADAVKITLRYLDAAAGVDFTWSRVIPESSPPRYSLPAAVWWPFDQTAAGKSAQIKIQRVTSGVLRPEKVVDVTFATAPLRGTIYYWEINNGSIAKIDADTGARTANYLTPYAGKGRCVACHTVSADGSTIVVQQDGGDGPSGVYDANTGNQKFDRPWYKAQWQALSPKGDWLVYGDDGALTVPTSSTPVATLRQSLDAAIGASTGTLIGSVYTTGSNIANPAFSPDGKSIAFASRNVGWGAWSGWWYGNWNTHAFGYFTGCQDWWCNDPGWGGGGRFTFNNAMQWGWGGSPWGNWGYSRYWWEGIGTAHWGANNRSFGTGYNTGNGNQVDGWYVDYSASSLWVADFKPSAPYFSNFRQVVSTDLARPVATYPSFTSAGADLVYQRADEVRTRDHLGELYMVGKNGGAPRELVQANGVVATGHLTTSADQSVSYEPTFSPQNSGGYEWMVFISNRSYGNTLASCGSQPSCGVKQMWVSAVDPAKAGDPSAPAFWLPGQEITNQNMRGFWAKSACSATGAVCSDNGDCCGNTSDPATSTASCRVELPLTYPLVRKCKAIVPGVCAKTTESCGEDSDCCNFTSTTSPERCSGGACAPYTPPPTYVTGEYTRDYEGVCPIGDKTIWRFFDWKTKTPSDSRIEIYVQTAPTAAALTTAPKKLLATVSGPDVTSWTGADVGSLVGFSDNWLRVTIELIPSTDKKFAPTLVEWRQNYSCPASE